ncbi:MAG: acyl-CoA thioesterase [Muribaculum sp.]|nr:acyl-CoA thioesterase [Muribaculum sp.]
MHPDYIYELTMKVRDYEVDSQGIVNNANYLHYLEHTRHEFCDSVGASFHAMQEREIDPVVARVEIDYRSPLHMGETFVSKLALERQGIRFVFYQDIFRTDGTLVVKGRIIVAPTRRGRLTRGDEMADLFKNYL